MDNKLNNSYMAAIYLRLSKEDEDLSSSLKYNKTESNSIANQKALILNELKSMLNVTLYDIYIDDGFSGLDFERPGFRRMRDDIYAGKVNMVIVKDLSRLGRDYIDAGRYVQKIFPSLNVRFLSVLDRFDSLTATESDINLLIPVKNFVNDNYSRDISGKIRSHQEVMRVNGLYVGSYVAYGYKKAGDDKNKIVPDEYAADIVKRIFAWKLSGISAAAIADKLNALGVITPSEYKKTLGINYKSGFQTKSKAKWPVQTVMRILTNKIYIGTLEQGKRRKVSYKISKIIERPEYEWCVIENNHEAIISKSDFENVERQLKVDTRVSPNADSLYALSGMLYCGDCGRIMVRRISRYKEIENIYYICTTYNRGKGCTRHSIDEKKLFVILLDTIKNHISSLVEMEAMLKELEKIEISYEDIIANDEEILSRYEELGKCKKSELALHKDLSEGTISLEEYKQFKKVYEDKSSELEISIHNIRQEIVKVFKQGLVSNDWLDNFKIYQNITSINRTVIITMVDKIVIYEDKKVEIYFKYQDEYQTLCRVIESAGHLTLSGGKAKQACRSLTPIPPGSSIQGGVCKDV